MSRCRIGRKHQSAQPVNIHIKTLAAPGTIIRTRSKRHHMVAMQKLYYALIGINHTQLQKYNFFQNKQKTKATASKLKPYRWSGGIKKSFFFYFPYFQSVPLADEMTTLRGCFLIRLNARARHFTPCDARRGVEYGCPV